MLKPLILFHFNVVMPALGAWIAGDRAAYTYLPASTQAFRTPGQLAGVMKDAGFVHVRHKRFMFGTMALHVGRKPGAEAAE